MLTKPAPNKTQFSEIEAAYQLGLSIEELRVLIRKHIVVNEEDVNNVPMTSFQPSDLLLLRLLAGITAPAPKGE